MTTTRLRFAFTMARRRPPRPSPLDDAAIDAIISANVAIASRFRHDLRERLISHTAELAHDKRWEAVAGIELSDEVVITIAANAAIPILSFDTWPYRQVRSIIVRPTTAMFVGTRAGPAAGTFTDETVPIVGEAGPHSGPVAISWDEASSNSRHPALGCNVVIHEFAHKIDMNDGYADGVPPLRGEALTRWHELMADEFQRSEGRDSDLVLRPYAWASPAEFFAVASEAFFCTPEQLRAVKPGLYGALSELYQQDPTADWAPVPT